MTLTDLPTDLGALRADSATITETARRTDELLASLPAPPERSPEQRARAARSLDEARALRVRFMDRHADAVYDELTGARTRFLDLAGLARAAAEAFPVWYRTRPASKRNAPAAGRQGRPRDRPGHLLPRRPALAARLAPPGRGDAAAHRAGPRPAAGVHPHRQGRADLRGPGAHRRRRPADHVPRRLPQRRGRRPGRRHGDRRRPGPARPGRGGPPAARRRDVPPSVPGAARVQRRDQPQGPARRRHLADRLPAAPRTRLHPQDPARRPPDGAASWRSPAIEKPWIAAVDTFAIGGGAQLLLVFDHVLAGADAFVSLPAAQEGIIPGASNFRLGRPPVRRPVRAGRSSTAAASGPPSPTPGC